MRLNSVGEFGLIEMFKKMSRLDRSVIVGPGDDCAVLAFNSREYLLYTCDMIVEGVDFRLKDKPGLIGRKALAVSLSDIAACAGTPKYAVVSLGLPRNYSLEDTKSLAKGLFALAREYKVNIVGGDISRAGRLTIDVSLIGTVKKSRLVLRKRARPGDIIFVTGELGGSISGKHLKFTPRLKESKFLTDNYKVTSMIDISDGLTQDLGHILKAGRVGARLNEALIPKSKMCRNINDALYGGEEFELLFTLPAKDASRLVSSGKDIFKPIGRICKRSRGFKIVGRDGKERAVKQGGWRHF